MEFQWVDWSFQTIQLSVYDGWFITDRLAVYMLITEPCMLQQFRCIHHTVPFDKHWTHWHSGSTSIIQNCLYIHTFIYTYPTEQAPRMNPETPGQAPFSFIISVLGSFPCITQHTGPTALHPIRRTKQLRLSVLLKDTSAGDRPGRDSTPHSDNTRTWVQCTRPLGHDTPKTIEYWMINQHEEFL